MVQQILLQDYSRIFSNIDYRLSILEYRLERCCHMVTRIIHCKKCLYEGRLNKLEVRHYKVYCDIKYCSKHECLTDRYVQQMKAISQIKEFGGIDKNGFVDDKKGYKKLWHFSLGFESIKLEDFKTNFATIKKEQEYVLNKMFRKLNKKGIKIEGIRVLDFSFVTDGMVYMHYHFGVIPIGQHNIRNTMIEIHSVINSIKGDKKHNSSMFYKDYGLKSKKAVLSYLAIRSAGMYKYEEKDKCEYDFKPRKLIESIKDGKYMTLDKVLTKEEYLRSFYNKASFCTIGGICRPKRQRSIITDNKCFSCEFHGVLERKDLDIKIVFDIDEPKSEQPPDFDENGNQSEEIKEFVIVSNMKEDRYKRRIERALKDFEMYPEKHQITNAINELLEKNKNEKKSIIFKLSNENIYRMMNNKVDINKFQQYL